MKRILLSVSIIFVSVLNMHAITKDEAYALFSSQVNENTMNVYSALITSSYLPEQVSTTGFHWAFFVDEEPQKGWAHSCSYYYVPYTNPNLTYTKVTASMPRTDIPFSWYKGNCFGSKQTIDLDYANLTQSQQNSVNHVYAIILNGGVSKYSNYIRYWNDCSFIYQTLTRHYGIPKENITVIMADGTDPTPDIPMGGGQFISSPTDLDGDGEVDIQYAATKTNVVSALANMRQNLTPQDKLLVFVTDHGGRDRDIPASYIYLWGGDTIYDYEVAAQLSGIPCRYVNFVFGQCYSGGFGDILQGHNRVVLTACDSNQVSYACSDFLFDEFIYHWISAINEEDYYGATVLADSLGDGVVSMCESYQYAISHDTKSETPQYKSQCEKIGKRSNLHMFSPKWDLMVRDSIGDFGLEPSMTYDTWSSPDILQRQNATDPPTMHETVQITDMEQMMYTWVRVINVGSEDYTGHGWFIHLYWSNAIAGISLMGWLGANNDPDFQRGGKCKSAQEIRDTIPAGGSKWVQLKWMLPEGISYYILHNNGAFHLCLLARISDESNDNDGNQMGLPNDPYQVDVVGDRRIAQKNVAVYANSRQASQGMTLLVSNLYDFDRDYSLEVVPSHGDTISFENLEIAIELSDPLYKAWEDGGKTAERVSVFKSNPKMLYAKGAGSKIDGLHLSPNQLCSIKCYSRVIVNKDIAEPKVYRFSIVQRDIKTGQIVGGEDYEILQQPRQSINPKIECIEKGNEFVLKATNVNEPACYKWFDETGKQIGEGEEVIILPQKKQTYTLEVETEKDGTVNQATIDVCCSQGFKSLVSLPSTNQLSLELHSPASDGTKIQITPTMTTGLVEEYRVKEGESEMTIQTSRYPKGLCIVSLKVNGRVVESRQVVLE